MDKNSLKGWAASHAQDGGVDDTSDTSLSLTSKLLRFRWNSGLAVGVGSDAPGTVRIHAVLDGVAWFLARAEPSDDALHLILGVTHDHAAAAPPLKEHLDAVGTLIAALRSGPQIRV